jgi:ligand-binding sensor domain-containing protein
MSGHVTAIEFGPDGTIYAGTSGWGVFRSDGIGNDWESIGLEGKDIHAMIIDPSGRLIVGTFGDGAYVTDDRGRTWRELNIGLSDTRIRALATDGDKVVLAGTFGSGIFAQHDGLTWRQSNEGLRSLDIRSLSFGSNGMALAASFHDGVMQSHDLGQTWSPLNGGSPLTVLRSVIIHGRMVVAAGFGGGVYTTYPREGEWSNINQGLPNQRVWKLAVTTDGRLVAGTAGHGTYFYDETASSWIPFGLPGNVVSALTVGSGGDIWAGTQSGLHHWSPAKPTWQLRGVPSSSIYSLAESELGTLVAASSQGGVFRSQTRGDIWDPTSLQLEDAYAVRRHGARLLAGAEFGRIYMSDDDGLSWIVINQDPSDERSTAPIRSIATVGDRIFAGSGGDGMLRSDDDGATWKRSGLDGYAIWTVTSDENDVVYAGTSRGMFRSQDGLLWQDASASLANVPIVTSLFDGDEGLLVGTDRGVYRSADGAGTWTSLGLNAHVVLSIIRGGDGALFAGTLEGGVFRKSASALDWNSVGFQNMSVRSLLYVQGSAQDEIFAATDGRGVYRTPVPKTGQSVTLTQPSTLTLNENFPNPFATSTTISFSLPRATTLRLDLYNVQGQLVDRLPARYLPSGHHQIEWHAGDLSSGVYYYILESDAGRASRRLILLR